MGTNLSTLHSFKSCGLPIGKACLSRRMFQTIVRMSNKPVLLLLVAVASKIV